jgi:hypothetical protein
LRVGGAANEQTGIIALGNDANAVGTYGDNGIFRGGIGTLGSANYTNISSYQGIVFNVGNAGFGSQATRMLIDVNGNVGIGTTSPSARLHVLDSNQSPATGNLLVTSTGGNASIRIDSNSTSNYTYFTLSQGGAGKFELGIVPTTSDLYINPTVQSGPNGAAIYIKKSDGNVGIGTTGPGAKLDVNGDIYARSGYGVYSNIIGPYTGDLTFYTSGTEKMRILSSGGNVGIGTTSPTAKLTVSSNLFLLGINAQRQYTYYSIGSANDDFYFRSSTSFANQGANFSMNLSRLTYQSAGSGNDLNDKVGIWLRGFYDNSGGGLPIYLGGYAYFSQIPAVTITGLNADGGGGSLGIGTSSPNAKLQVNSTTSGATLLRADGTSGTLFSVVDDLTDSLMSVNNSAGLPVFEVFADDRIVGGQYGANDFVITNNRVGIGTSNPLAELHVTGSASVPAAVFYGNVGIGTSTFSYPTSNRGLLELYGNTDALLALRSAGTNFYIHKPGVDCYIVNTNSGFISIYNNGSERMSIRSDGKVGIGTSSPNSQLTILGDGTQNTVSGVLRVADVGSSKWGSIGLPDVQSTTTAANNYYLIGRGGAFTDRVLSIHIPNATDYGSGAQPKFGVYSTGSDLLASVEANTGTSYFKGYVGIGTTSPTQKLDIVGSYGVAGDDSGILKIRGGVTSATQLNFGVSADGGYGWIQGTDVGATNNINIVLNPIGGNVGIGSTSPTQKLDVNGSIYTSGKLVQRSATQSLSGTTGCTIDLANGAVHILSLANATTISSFTYNSRDNNPSVNTLMLVFKYAGTASVTFTNVIWANGVTPTLTGTNGYADVFMLTSYQGGAGTPVWIGTVVAQALVSTNL